MSRGRLLNWFLVDLKLLDPASTDGPISVGTAQVLDSGYDPVFRRTRKIPDGTWQGADAKQYTTETLKAQVAHDQFDNLTALINGNELQHKLALLFHFKDLERVGMVDVVTGVAKLRVNAQLMAYRDRKSKLIQDTSMNGIYAIECRTVGFGLGESRNLLMVRFECRVHGAASG